MSVQEWWLTLTTLSAWGVGSFVAKLATQRIGEKSVFWDLPGYIAGMLTYSLLMFKFKAVISAEKCVGGGTGDGSQSGRNSAFHYGAIFAEFVKRPA